MLKKIGFIAIGMMLVSLMFAAAINGVIDIPEVTVSSNPPSGWQRLFFKSSDHLFYARDSAGAELAIGAITNKRGNTTKVQMAGAGTPATDDCAKFDVNGNLVSAGAPCGAGGGGSSTLLLHTGYIQTFRGGAGFHAAVTGTTVTLPAIAAGTCFIAEFFSDGFTAGGGTEFAFTLGGTRVITLTSGTSGVGNHQIMVCNNASVQSTQMHTWVGPGVAASRADLSFDLSAPMAFGMVLAGSDTYLTLRNFNVRLIK